MKVFRTALGAGLVAALSLSGQDAGLSYTVSAVDGALTSSRLGNALY